MSSHYPVPKTKGHHGAVGASFIDRLKAWPQYLLPHYLLTDLMYLLTRSKIRWWKNSFTRWFAYQYRVDMSLAVNEQLTAYDHFNAFFTRPLKPEVRPVCDTPGSIACPVDGTVSQVGHIADEAIFQAKGHDYSLTALLAGQPQWVDTFRNGNFITMYLSPRDYHRIHMPLDGTLQQMTYVPGQLFSVSPATTRAIPNLFAKNERVICYFQTPLGPMAMILVGALFVGSIETVWHGMVTPPHGKRLSHWDYEEGGNADAAALTLRKGEEMGRFNMGSTVILLLGEHAAQWNTDAGAKVQMGLQIGTQQQ
jgi:phosphatidylserine decarboxylase